MFIEDKTLQHVLVKLGDLVIDEHVQTKELVPLLVEPKDFQHVGFESVSTHLTLALEEKHVFSTILCDKILVARNILQLKSF
jgi:hypothetical protein